MEEKSFYLPGRGACWTLCLRIDTQLSELGAETGPAAPASFGP